MIGTGSKRLLIDTGEGKRSWSLALSSLLSSERATITCALITHWHHDHVGGIEDIRILCPHVTVYKESPALGQKAIENGQIFQAEGASLQAFHCPGHTIDHMAFILKEEDAMFTGDNVLGHGTAVFEDLATYMNSLTKMQKQFNGRAYPGHGAVIEDGKAKITEYIEHRKGREEEILQALGDVKDEATPMDLVKVVYKDVPEGLHAPAANGVVQVLRKLESEGKVSPKGNDKWYISEKVML